MNCKSSRRFTVKVPPALRKITAAALVPAILVLGQPLPSSWAIPASLSGVEKMPDPVLTPKKVVVNRTVPTEAKSWWPQLRFSVTAEDIFKKRVLVEPLVPVGTEPNKAENRALSHALDRFVARTQSDDGSTLEEFLSANANSPWALSLLCNLGDFYYRTGQYQKTISAYQRAWELGKNFTEGKGKALADQAFGQLAMMQSRIGEAEKLNTLLDEGRDRVFSGPSTELIANAQEARWRMKNDSGLAFHCGPLALAGIRRANKLPNAYDPLLKKPRSAKEGRGFKLSELEQLASSLGMAYEMIKAEPGFELTEAMLPAVVHWKVNHYAAIIKKDGNRYLLKDQTFGSGKTWVTGETLRAEASGYYLVPKGSQPLKPGMAKIGRDEASRVVGKGITNGKEPPTCPTPQGGDDGKGCGGMIRYSFDSFLIALRLQDRPTVYEPPVGPVPDLGVEYNQRDSEQPLIFDYTNFGPKWSGKLIAYVQDDPTNAAADAKIYAHGYNASFIDFNATTQEFAPQLQTRDLLKRVTSSPVKYERLRPDGSKEVYAQSNGVSTPGRKVFLTQEIDPQGNTLTLHYDSLNRLVATTDAIGQVSTFSYGLTNSPYLVTRITDPFGRNADFEYDATGRLKKITDVIGMESSVEYGPGDFVNAVTTPYGRTRFAYGEKGAERWLEATDPYGDKERIEFRNHDVANNDRNAPIPNTETVIPSGISSPSLTNDYLSERNTFYWDKKAMKLAPGDYSKATITHWMHFDENFNILASVPESKKKPYESRVWFTYPNQNDSNATNEGMIALPKNVARVLSDGTTQRYQYTYNDYGLPTGTIDPEGRKFTYVYAANGIDMLEQRQTRGGANELVRSATYYSNHRVHTDTDAASQTTTYTYTTRGQVETITNAKGEVTTYSYDPGGYLLSITGDEPGAVTTFTYDGFGRIRTKTLVGEPTLTYDYDALNRVTKITFPDGTYSQTIYDRLDPVAERDRQGRWTRNYHNDLGQLVAVKDPLGRVVNYEWCKCGKLQAITDAKKQVTRWKYNEQGQQVEKIFADGTKEIYTYDNANRLATRTDALNQVTTYAYFRDNNLKSRTYANVVNPTPNVSFTYDADYDRMKTMSDGSGTGSGGTSWDYRAMGSGLGSGQVSSINGSLTSDLIEFGYDELGRVIQRKVNGNAVDFAFDNLGRMSQVVSALGTFDYDYVGDFNRLDSVTYPNGQSSHYDYFPEISATSGLGNGDYGLKQILHKRGTTPISQFDYTYELDHSIKTWTTTAGTATAIESAYSYDAADRLMRATQTQSAAVIRQLGYAYDSADNRTVERIDGAVTTTNHNNVNQIISASGGGTVAFAGGTDEESTVVVNGTPAVTLSGGQRFERSVLLSTGTQTVNVTATDPSGNAKSQDYDVMVSGGASQSFIYDTVGNLLEDGLRSYAWDAENRLVKITEGTKTTDIEYDGLHRWTRVLDKDGSTTLNDRRFLWHGTQLVEQRNGTATSAVQRYFAEGVQQGSNLYSYTRDHLGSIREVTNASGVVVARYDYDPYGRRTKLSGGFDSDFGFTGHYHHAVSNLNFAPYRMYSANLGRWLSRDPLENAELDEGPNVYEYANNNSLRYFDPTGESSKDSFEPDNSKHGGPHVDWYRNGKNMGRYNCDGSGIPHGGKVPPKIPNSLWNAFKKAAGKLGNKACYILNLFNNATSGSTNSQMGPDSGSNGS